MTTEIWKEIDGYDGFYIINQSGIVKSLPRIVERSYHGNLPVHGRTLRYLPGIYLTVTLHNKEKVFKKLKVHRLVALAFIPNPNNLEQVNHKDGNKHNNHVSNLEWCTRSENVLHAVNVLGLQMGANGEANGNVKLSNDQVTEIRRLREIYSGRALAKMFNISYANISLILNYKSRRTG